MTHFVHENDGKVTILDSIPTPCTVCAGVQAMKVIKWLAIIILGSYLAGFFMHGYLALASGEPALPATAWFLQRYGGGMIFYATIFGTFTLWVLLVLEFFIITVLVFAGEAAARLYRKEKL